MGSLAQRNHHNCMSLPSIRSLKTGSLFLAALAAATLPAFAGTETTYSSKDKNPVIQKPVEEPRFYVNLLAGGEFDFHATHFITNGDAFFFAPPIAPTLPLAGAAPGTGFLPATIKSRDFETSHDIGVTNGRVELGYQVLPYLSVFVGGTFSHSNGNNEEPIGTIFDPGALVGAAGGRYNLFADTSRYQAYSGIAGLKINTPRTLLDLLHIPRAIKPYVTVSAGGKYLESQSVSFYNGAEYGIPVGALVNSGQERLYNDGFVFTVEGESGFELGLTRNISVNLESGYGYDTHPDRGGLSANIEGVNKGGDRFYSTVSLGARIRF